MRALFSGVTGIRSHQVRMDVIGNNIANVNTTGFKGSRVTFQDVFSQTMSAGSASTTPQQVGLGVAVASTDLNNSPGSFQLTGREMDLAIEGNGLFILKGGDGQRVYTRVGNFDWDAEGFLVNPATGSRVQGWMADDTGGIASTGLADLSDIKLVKGDVDLAKMTALVSMGGNLDAGTTVSAGTDPDYVTPYTAYDSLGNPVSLTVAFKKSAGNTWDVTITAPAGRTISGGTANLTFNPDGTLLSPDPATFDVTMTMAGTDDQTMTIDVSKITQAYAGTAGSTVLARKADGAPMGVLESVSVDAAGQVTGVFSNGFRRRLGQLGMALFTNPNGLLKVGSTGFSESSSSGAPVVGTPNSGGRGRMIAGNLEMSNVDLSTEFTNMIMTQRGFQANTRIISAADEMLQDVVNLRR